MNFEKDYNQMVESLKKQYLFNSRDLSILLYKNQWAFVISMFINCILAFLLIVT